MSVNINFRPTSNETRWNSIKNGDFAVVEGNNQHPIPMGLYRIFTIPAESQINPEVKQQNFLAIPMFDGPFQDGMFPYMISENPFPLIKQIVNKVHIDVEINS